MATNADFAKALRETFDQCLEIVNKKNHDYATEYDPFRNFRFAQLVGLGVEDAIMVRISDKLARVTNLIHNQQEAEVKDEAIEDTLVDLANYSAILKVYREWKRNGMEPKA